MAGLADADQPDPWAHIRTLPISWMDGSDGYYGDVGDGSGYISGTAGQWQLDFESLRPYGLQSKYNQIEQLPDGRLKVRLQQPGAHKYDTMDAIYAQDANGQWVLQNDPMEAKTRTGDNGILRDPRKDLRNLGMDLGLSERVATGLSQGGTGSAALMVTDLARGVNSLGGDGDGWVGRLNREVMRNAKADARTEERGAARAALIAGAAYGSGYLGAGGTAAGTGGADMGAMMAGSADGGALAASGSGVTGGTAAGAGTIAGGSGLSAGGSAGLGGTGAGLSTAGTAAGGTATGLGSTGLGAAGTTAGTTGGGAMAGMTASDWINLGGLVYSVANRPDPVDTSGLEREAARAGNIADRQQTLAERQYADQLAIFNEFKPMLMQQIQGSLQDQSLSRQRSNQQWDDYMSTWRPAEQALAERSLNWATPGRMQAAADEASSAVAGQYDAQRSQATEDMIRAGLDPSSIAALTASGRALEAKDRAGAATSARRTVESQGMAYLDNAARFGRNMPSTGLAAAGLAGQQGQQVQSNYSGLVNASAAPATAASPLFSSAVNSGSSAGGLYRNIAGMQADSQQQQRDWDMGTLAGLNQWAGQGGAARTGNSFGGWFTSSKKTKRVGARVRNSLQDVEDAKVMRWRYKEGEGDGNTKPRMGPMAEDLKRVAPEVSDGNRVDGVSLLGLHHAAIGEASSKLKKQAKKIAALERKMSLADAA